MTQNATLIFDSLFLHETQMTDLEREQTTLRKIYSGLTGNEPAERPFNFAPPFCPLPENMTLSGKLTIGEPAVSDGWIVRPVSGQKSGESRDRYGTTDGEAPTPNSPIDVHGYPPLPGETCFILGYAGDFAKALLERAQQDEREGARNGPTCFTISARYRATLTLETAYEDGKSFSCAWTVGPARWEKA